MSKHEHIASISQRINELIGLHFAAHQWDSLERRLQKAAVALQLDSDLACVHKWISKQNIPDHELKILIDHLTICETYFFREKAAFSLLKNKIIPSVVPANDGKKKCLNIWSAGCSSGEEPYSLAILLKESLPNMNDWQITILGTDINSNALEKAKKGVYSPWSFRDTPESYKNNFFVARDKRLELKTEIKQMVTFGNLNLAVDTFPASPDDSGLWDVIFCRNVLMYFSPEVIMRITKKLFNNLKIGGWLITSQVELNDEYFSDFQKIVFDRGIFYKKCPEKLNNKQSANKQIINSIPPVLPLPRLRTKKKVDRTAIKIADKDQKPREKHKHQVNHQHTIKNTTVQEVVTNQTQLLFEKAKAYADKGKLHEAEKIMLQLLENGSDYADHLYLYATIMIENDRLVEADKFLIKVLYLDPGHLAARLNRSQLLKKAGEHGLANKQMQNLMNDIKGYDDNETLPYLEGITAGGMRQIARLFLNNEE